MFISVCFIVCEVICFLFLSLRLANSLFYCYYYFFYQYIILYKSYLLRLFFCGWWQHAHREKTLYHVCVCYFQICRLHKLLVGFNTICKRTQIQNVGEHHVVKLSIHQICSQNWECGGWREKWLQIRQFGVRSFLYVLDCNCNHADTQINFIMRGVLPILRHTQNQGWNLYEDALG